MKKIILVDDDPDILEVVKLILERAGYDVKTFLRGMPLLENGYEPPDVIILDKQLPDIDGLEVCRQLKTMNKTKNIPVIMLSANPDIKHLGRNAGAVESIEKPFSPKTLRKLVAKYAK